MRTPAELKQLKSTIIHLLEIGWTPSSIAQEFNISHQTVEHLARCEAAKDALRCPFCKGPAGLADPNDVTSDFGCVLCGAFVDVSGEWTPAYPRRQVLDEEA